MAGLKACRESMRKKARSAEKPNRTDSTPARPGSAHPRDLDILYSMTLDPSRDSSLTESDASTLANPFWFPPDENTDLTYDFPTRDPRGPRDSLFHGPTYTPNNMRGQGAKRRDSGLTDSTDPSVTSSFRARLSHFTQSELKTAFVLVKRYTLPKEDESTASPSFPSIPIGPYSQRQTNSRSPRFIVPGDFLKINPMWHPENIPNAPPNEMNHGWIKLVGEVLSTPNLWPSKGRCSISLDHPWDLLMLNPTVTDDFGNSIFHFLAANDNQKALYDQILQARGGPHQSAIGSRNTAGQTLLHVLHPSWYEEGAALHELLDILRDVGFDVLARDVYGRNFFHLLRQNQIRHDRIRGLAQPFDMKALNRRDAFGNKPMHSRSAQFVQRAAAIHMIGRRRPSQQQPPRLSISTEDPEAVRLRASTALLKVITSAVRDGPQANPDAEDAEGRNGFHCLAEVKLANEQIRMPAAAPAQKHAQSPPKRKRDDVEADAEASTSAGTGANAAATDANAGAMSRMDPKLQRGAMSHRLELLRGLIEAGADPNHYDRAGQTPLMAFVQYLEDGKREDTYLRQILARLVAAGADPEARNRRGETALFMAARLGKKVAVSQLLELGASPCARVHALAPRDGDGGEEGEQQQQHALEANQRAMDATPPSDTVMYGRLQSCHALLTGRLGERWRDITALDEWGINNDNRRPAITTS